GAHRRSSCPDSDAGSLDRLPSNELAMKQDSIAEMLGVRREGVSKAAASLRREGLIRYTRGCIALVDRYAVEARACECYAVVKREYDRLLPPGRGLVHAGARGSLCAS
ncbi:MAG TPA: helix-turn-helix domain-containing protein, partial [Usitatibacter sp.]|nr:helix-turn-helix domain-containing protein [Usitatibacter sp.]